MHDHAQDVSGTGKNSVRPDRILKTETFLLLLARAAHVLAHELVDLIIGRISQHIVTIVVDQELLPLLLCEWNGLPQLPIRLAIQLVCLDEDRAALLCRLEEDEVGGDALPLHYLNDLANFDVFRGDWNDSSETLLLTLQDSILAIVEFFVAAEAIEIVPPLLNHRHDQHKCQRSNVGEEEADLEEGYELTNRDDQEEHVEEELELVVEHLEDEAEHVVLLIVQTVGDEVRRRRGALHAELALLFRDDAAKVALESITAAKVFNLVFILILHRQIASTEVRASQ